MANGVCSVLVGKLHKPVSALCDLPSRYFVKHHLRQHLKDILQWEKNRIKISNGKKK